MIFLLSALLGFAADTDIDQVNYKAMTATLLPAKLAKERVALLINGCVGSAPRITGGMLAN